MQIKSIITATVLILLCASVALATDSIAPLADATQHQDVAKLEKLLKASADLNAAQVDGMTALHWAIYYDEAPLAKRLIAAGANIKATNKYGVAPLSLAWQNGNAELVEYLLNAGADPETTLRGGETVLMTAARTGNLQPVRALLERDVDVNAKERNGQTALMWAAAEGHANVVQTLLDAGADLHITLSSGYNALFFAVREGKTDTVRVLLKAGADVNEAMQPTKRPSGKSPVVGTSPLLLAIENGHFELAVVLLEAGADPNDQRSGYSPLHTLTWVRNPNRGDGDDGVPPPIGSGNLTSLEFAKALVDHGADVNLRLKKGPSGKGVLGKTGATPFLMATATADVAYMKALVKLGADPLLSNAEHCTPLLAAAGVGVTAPEETAGTEPEVIDAINLAIELGCDVNAVDDNGETAMHGAAYRCFPKVAQLLADKGAKIETWNRANRQGWTPMMIAEGRRNGAFKPSAEVQAVLHRLLGDQQKATTANSSTTAKPSEGYSDSASASGK